MASDAVPNHVLQRMVSLTADQLAAVVGLLSLGHQVWGGEAGMCGLLDELLALTAEAAVVVEQHGVNLEVTDLEHLLDNGTEQA